MQLIFIDFPLDQAAFNASKILNCLDKTKQITFLDTVYETQMKWTNGSNLDDINNMDYWNTNQGKHILLIIYLRFSLQLK